MIRKSIVITNLLYGLFSFGQTTSEMNLKGKVKSIDQVYEKCPTIALVGSNINCYEQKETFYFDKKGLRTYLESQKDISYSYIEKKSENPNGYVITKYLDNNGQRTKYFEEYYNKKGLQVKIISYHADGEITNIWEYFYDKKGRKTENKSSNIWNGTTTVYHNWFNEYGDITARKEFRNDELVKEESFDINYTFDKKGNWTSKHVEGEYSEFYKRTILYY